MSQLILLLRNTHLGNCLVGVLGTLFVDEIVDEDDDVDNIA